MAEQLVVSNDMLDALNGTRPWVKFLAILGFIVMAFMVLAGLITFVGFTAIPGNTGLPHIFGPIFGIAYIVVSVFFYLIPCIYLYRYSNAITRIPEFGQSALEDALKYQKSFWKYMGIFAIVVIAAYILMIVGGIAFAVIYGLGHHP
ncbi:MAG: hypothetical protein ACRESX_01235 [Gammaproteobacteria bacterium]